MSRKNLSEDILNILPRSKPKFKTRKEEREYRRTRSNVFNKFKDNFLLGIGDTNSSNIITSQEEEISTVQDTESSPPISSIWAVDMAEGLVLVGTKTGVVEVWDVGESEGPKATWDDGKANPISHIRLQGGRVVAARLDGSIDFLEIQSVGCVRQEQQSRMRFNSISSVSQDSLPGWLGEEIRLVLRSSSKAHMQVIQEG